MNINDAKMAHLACQSSGDRYSPRGTVSVAMLLCYCLAGSDRLHPMIDIRSAVTPFNYVNRGLL
ncbi:hypothetical protein T05_10122 [Trichinella murrelli]|uniref:Uncharacterized protein n=1 Tax=Trichinella murrelli TaxID=144512 RepID=A0A0V0T4C2_9BILA|nr:hypothetical protein T05_10122 [Trichinella murrelli]